MVTEASARMAKRQRRHGPKTELRLPADVVLEILSWLPLISVFRLSHVSKQWRDIAGCRRFRQLHSRRSCPPPYPEPPTLFYSFTFEVPPLESRRQLFFHMSWLGSSTRRTIRLDLDEGLLSMSDAFHRFYPDIFQVDLRNSPPMPCNGLLCIAPVVTLRRVGPVVVCNPLTLEYITLPPPSTDSSGYCLYTALGFSPLSGLYKAVRLVATGPSVSGKRVMEVYTLGVDTSWRKTSVVLDFFGGYLNSKNVLYVDGRIHWILHGMGPKQEATSMVTFDVDSEDATYLTPNIPCLEGDLIDSVFDFRLVQLSSSGLSLFVKRALDQVFRIQVWVLRGQHGKCIWNMRHNIEWSQPQAYTMGRKDIDIMALWEPGNGGFEIVLSNITVSFNGQTVDLKQPMRHETASSCDGDDDGGARALVPCHGYKPSLEAPCNHQIHRTEALIVC